MGRPRGHLSQCDVPCTLPLPPLLRQARLAPLEAGQQLAQLALPHLAPSHLLGQAFQGPPHGIQLQRRLRLLLLLLLRCAGRCLPLPRVPCVPCECGGGLEAEGGGACLVRGRVGVWGKG